MRRFAAIWTLALLGASAPGLVVDEERRFGRIEPGSGPAVAAEVADEAWQVVESAKPDAPPSAPKPAPTPDAASVGTPGSDAPRSIAHLLKPQPAAPVPAAGITAPDGEVARPVLEAELAAAQAAVASRAPMEPAAASVSVDPRAERPLGPGSEERTLRGGADGGVLSGIGGAAGLARTGLALAIVVGLIFALAWLLKRIGRTAAGGAIPGLSGRAPSGILEVLGRYPIGPKQALVLLKFDRRVLLLSQTTTKQSSEMTTLCELTDPEDVASVMLKARDALGDTAARSFAGAMHIAELDAGEAERRATSAVLRPEPAAQAGTDSYMEPKPIGATRRMAAEEAIASERAELWGEPVARGEDHPASSLRRRLEALREGRSA